MKDRRKRRSRSHHALAISWEECDAVHPHGRGTRDSTHFRFGRLGFVKEKGVELSSLAETKVDGKPAVGVVVKSKGHRDVKLYFDKASGLLVKREHPVVDPSTGKEVVQEVLFRDYQDKDGLK